MEKDYFFVTVKKNHWIIFSEQLEKDFPYKVTWNSGAPPTRISPIFNKNEETYLIFSKEERVVSLSYSDKHPSESDFIKLYYPDIEEIEDYLVFKKIISQYLGEKVDTEEEKDHNGMIQNPVTGEWKWF